MSLGGGQQQEAIVSGPTLQAAQSAGAAQSNAAMEAANVATQNTNASINALMQQYTTGLGLTAPIRAEGNNASAQLNYMLGLNPYNPGAAPTPVNLASEEAQITPSEVNNYINQNSQLIQQANTGAGAAPGQQEQYYQYQGAGSNDAALQAQYATGWGQATAPGQVNPYPGGVTSTVGTNYDSLAAGSLNASAASQAFQGNTQIAQDATQALAQQQLNQDLPTYNAQLQSYNQAEGLYNQYSAAGPATAANISDIVQNQPGFQFSQQQGINSIQNSASASGMLNSGSILQQLNQFGQGLSQSYYQNYLGNLQGLAGLGTGATQQASASVNQTGANVAGAYGNLTTDVGNAYLAAGQAAASSYLSPAVNQQIIATPVGSPSSNGIGSLLGSAGGILSSLSSSGAGAAAAAAPF
jgi:hypothetical protein